VSTELVHPRTARTLTMEIDHRTVAFPEGVTVLRAAELNGVYVPSLCSHKELTPFGGCRLCTVEIEGMRGYPLACSTLALAGMKVLTDSVALREMRQEILQLILSEHPSSCLFCDEREACGQSLFTIRKVGVTTGCRSCPNDGHCELQQVVERVGVTQVGYPVIYRGFEAEHDDPFFDRDYNLCILCGRCVRMCQEVRGTSVLAFKYRGPKTQIGTAFGQNHVEAGCEFCGACVCVCPTGALADKTSKWDGEPDGVETSTCPFCSIGCQVEVFHKDGRLSRVGATLDGEINDGQLCVRGRFCMPEATHHHDRARKPMLRRGKYFREVTWDEALAEVAARLQRVTPQDVLVMASGDLTNESLWAAQRFVRTCLGSSSIDSSARAYLPGGLDLWARLLALPISIRSVSEADTVIAAGFDSRFTFSVAGVQIRRALRRGARLVTVDARESNLARYTEYWLRPRPGDEARLLTVLLRRLVEGEDEREATRVTGVSRSALAGAAHALAAGQDTAVVIGPRVLAGPGARELLDALAALAAKRNLSVLPLCHGGNTRGALELGAFGELLPGMVGTAATGITLADVRAGRARPHVLYLVGETPFSSRPDCDFVIAQDIYLPPFEVDAFLPAASFAEAEGTLTNIEGRVQALARIEHLPEGATTGFARPDWLIFSQLADRLGGARLDYHSAAEALAEIHQHLPGFPGTADRSPRRLPPTGAAEVARPAARGLGNGPVLVIEPGGFRHRGIDLSAVVEGLGELNLEHGLRMNPLEIARLGIAPGGLVTVSAEGLRVSLPAHPDPDCPPGAAYAFGVQAWGGLAARVPLPPLFEVDACPIRVTLQPTGAEDTPPARARHRRAGRGAATAAPAAGEV